MDNGLVPRLQKRMVTQKWVLILIVVDNGLVLDTVSLEEMKSAAVLILIVVDNGLVRLLGLEKMLKQES